MIFDAMDRMDNSSLRIIFRRAASLLHDRDPVHLDHILHPCHRHFLVAVGAPHCRAAAEVIAP